MVLITKVMRLDRNLVKLVVLGTSGTGLEQVLNPWDPMGSPNKYIKGSCTPPPL